MKNPLYTSDVEKGRRVSKLCEAHSQLARSRFIRAFGNANEQMLASFTYVTTVQGSRRVNRNQRRIEPSEPVFDARYFAQTTRHTWPREHRATLGEYCGVFNKSCVRIIRIRFERG